MAAAAQATRSVMLRTTGLLSSASARTRGLCGAARYSVRSRALPAAVALGAAGSAVVAVAFCKSSAAGSEYEQQTTPSETEATKAERVLNDYFRATEPGLWLGQSKLSRTLSPLWFYAVCY